MNLPTKSFADYMGITSSSLCLIHCIATPLLLSIGANLFTYPAVEYAFLLLSFIAIYKTTAPAKKSKISLLLWLSFAVFLVSTVLKEQYGYLHYTAYAASFSIICGHILHMRQCKKYSPNECTGISNT